MRPLWFFHLYIYIYIYIFIYVYLIRSFEYFLRIGPYFDKPVGQITIQTTNKNTQRYYTPKYLIPVVLSNCLFFCLVFLFISLRAGKAKWIEKLSMHSQLVKQAFLQYKITNCPNNHTISQDICSLFAHYLYSTLCRMKDVRQTKMSIAWHRKF